MFFSIIIPIFNVENYLKKCVESVLNQNFKDIEILLIDDCSTDGSLAVAKFFAFNDNVKVIKKEKNSGLSDTRNIGLSHATGTYILFLDSDDYVENNCLEKLQSLIIQNNCPDIIYTGFIEEKDSNSSKLFGYAGEKNKLYAKHDFLQNELEKRTLYAPACFGVYKRQLIMDNNILFKVGILHEDELWTPQVVFYADSIYTSDYAFYHYVRREISITKAIDKTKNGLDLINSCIELDEFFSQNAEQKIEKLMKNHIAMVYMKAMCIGKLYRKDYRKKIKRCYPLKNTCFIKDKCKAILFAVSLRGYYLLDHWMGTRL